MGSADASADVCLICQDALQGPPKGQRCTLACCRTRFHSRCLHQWLSVNTHCPHCRHPDAQCVGRHNEQTKRMIVEFLRRAVEEQKRLIVKQREDLEFYQQCFENHGIGNALEHWRRGRNMVMVTVRSLMLDPQMGRTELQDVNFFDREVDTPSPDPAPASPDA
jgi:hypothetical protein